MPEPSSSSSRVEECKYLSSPTTLNTNPTHVWLGLCIMMMMMVLSLSLYVPSSCHKISCVSSNRIWKTVERSSSGPHFVCIWGKREKWRKIGIRGEETKKEPPAGYTKKYCKRDDHSWWTTDRKKNVLSARQKGEQRRSGGEKGRVRLRSLKEWSPKNSREKKNGIQRKNERRVRMMWMLMMVILYEKEY